MWNTFRPHTQKAGSLGNVKESWELEILRKKIERQEWVVLCVCVCGGGWGGGELWERTFQIILTSLNQMQLSYFPNTATWDKAHVCTNTNILVGSKTRAHVLGNGIEIIYDLVFSILDALPPGILHTGGPSLWGYPQKLSALLKLIFIGVQLLYNVMLVSAVQQNESAVHIHTADILHCTAETNITL